MNKEITINLRGGLGNQMFSYAAGRALSLDTNIPLALDTHSLEKGFTKDTARTYKLNAFNVAGKILTDGESASRRPGYLVNLYLRLYRKFFPENPYTFYEIPAQSAAKYHDGVWRQNELYFAKHRETILKDFTLKDPFGTRALYWSDEMKKNNLSGVETISLHIRGGDYITNKHAHAHHGVLPASYYASALAYLSDKVLTNIKAFLYVFTDDIPYFTSVWNGIDTDITSHFIVKIVSETEVSVDSVKDFEEIILMSQCKHNIIANSSFSWWGAWLNENKDKTIIAPKQWLANQSIDTSGACPKNWIRL